MRNRFGLPPAQVSARVVKNYRAGIKAKRAVTERYSAKVVRSFAAAELPAGFAVATDAAIPEILLYDEIGYWGVSAKDFMLALAQVGPGEIILRINSPGGDVFDGEAIYNALLRRDAPVHVVVDGLAASAASFIAMAGADIEMGEASMLMIHNAWGFAIGDRNDMLETAAVLEKIDGQLAAIYAKRTGGDLDTMAALMDAETWLTADEALAAKFCDRIGPETASDAPAARAALAARFANAVAPYDPDGDGDNDAAEALAYVEAARTSLAAAAAALNGGGDDLVIDPGAAASRLPQTDIPDADKLKSDKFARLRRLRVAEAEDA